MGAGLDAIEAVPRWRCAEEKGHLGALHARRKGEAGPFRRRWEHRGPIPVETLQREVSGLYGSWNRRVKTEIPDRHLFVVALRESQTFRFVPRYFKSWCHDI
jgi:hypothetical protein